MARKKYKIKLDGLEMTASNSWDIKEIETACTLAAIQRRSEGHLAVYDKFMNMSLEIKKQLSDCFLVLFIFPCFLESQSIVF